MFVSPSLVSYVDHARFLASFEGERRIATASSLVDTSIGNISFVDILSQHVEMKFTNFAVRCADASRAYFILLLEGQTYHTLRRSIEKKNK